MLALLQRVAHARVEIAGRPVAAIGPGALALVGVQRTDGPEQVRRLAERMLAWRMFADDAGKMNRSLQDTQGGLLLVPQFTLAAATDRGHRAGFSAAAPPERARLLFEQLLQACRARHAEVGAGAFGAAMQVHLTNDGPVTFLLRT